MKSSCLDEVLTPYPRNRLHDQHPQPPASFQSRQRNRPIYRGSILDADPPAKGVNIASRMTPTTRQLGFRSKIMSFTALKCEPVVRRSSTTPILSGKFSK